MTTTRRGTAVGAGEVPASVAAGCAGAEAEGAGAGPAQASRSAALSAATDRRVAEAESMETSWQAGQSLPPTGGSCFGVGGVDEGGGVGGGGSGVAGRQLLQRRAHR